MEIDTGAASSVISEQQFSPIRRRNWNLVLSKDGLPKLNSGAYLHPTDRVMVDNCRNLTTEHVSYVYLWYQAMVSLC